MIYVYFIDSQINLKKNNLIKVDSIYENDEKDCMGLVKPFVGEFEDYSLEVLLFDYDEFLYSKVFKVEGYF